MFKILLTLMAVAPSVTGKMTDSLVGKVALVTGSTSGIGLGIAKSLANAGADVILNGSRDVSAVQSVLEEFQSHFSSSRFTYEQADLSKEVEIARMMESAAAKLGGIDILVNNAGIQHVAPVDEFPVEMWQKIIDINLSSVFHTTRLALPHMKQRKWGRVVNISSVHGLVGSPNKAAYVASKHGVLGFTKVAALENARTGVTVNSICPGWVLTPLVEKQIKQRAADRGVSFEEAQLELLLEKQPSGQFVTPEQIGKMVVFMCSDAASEVRGVSWTVDGGWTSI